MQLDEGPSQDRVTSRSSSSEQQIGDIGIGKGGSARARPKAATTNDDVNARIRRGARVARTLTVPDGVAVDVDDLFGDRP